MILICVGLLLVFPVQVGARVRYALQICAERLIPALFPISVLAGCLIRICCSRNPNQRLTRLTEYFFGLPGNCAVPLLLGLLGGYPLGAQLTADMYRNRAVTKAEAIVLTAISNNAGPAFIIGVLGNVLGDRTYGFTICVIHILSVFFTGFLLRPSSIPCRRIRMSSGTLDSGFLDLLPQAIGVSVSAMLQLTGTVVLFHSLCAAAEAFLPLQALPAPLRATLAGVLELAGGAEQLRSLPVNTAFPLAAILTGWGGFCVHMQAASVLRAAGLPIRRYLLGKLLHGAISALFSVLYLSFRAGQMTSCFVLSTSAVAFLFFFSILKNNRWKTSVFVI